MNYKNSEQVISKLKAFTEEQEKAIWKAKGKLDEFNINSEYKDLNYRPIAGPYKVRDNEFRNSKGTYWFDPIRKEATSYRWWSMLTVHNGKLIRNRCGYSMSTSGHQRLLDKALAALNITPDITVYTKANVGDLGHWKKDLLNTYAEAVVKLEFCQSKSKKQYSNWVKSLEKDLINLEKAKIGLKFSDKDKKEAVSQAKTSRTQRLERAKARKTRDNLQKQVNIQMNKSLELNPEN